MEKFKWMYLLVLVSGLILGGCSSENDIIDNIDGEPDIDNTDKRPDFDFSKLTWTKRTISSQIEAGNNTDISTRSAEDIGFGGNPSSVLPDDLNYYINVYNEGVKNYIEDDFLELTYENNEIIYFTTTATNNGKQYVLINNIPDVTENADYLYFEIGDNISSVPGNRIFFFTTYNLADKKNDSKIKLPKAIDVDGQDLYYNGNGYAEYGDKLFATEGLFFIRNSENSDKIDLYYLNTNNRPVLADEYKIKMRRLTGVITIYTIVIDRYEDNTPISITGVDGGTTTVSAISLTNDALAEAFTKLKETPEDFFSSEELAANNNALRDFISNKFDQGYGVDDYFIRKKVIENFPVEYDFLAATVDYQTTGPLYLCNLNFPAWMNEKSVFHWGSDATEREFYGVSSFCDNYPFLPIGHYLSLDYTNSLIIYMGMSKRDTENTTYAPPSHLLQVKIAIKEQGILLQPNINHNMYVVFTIKDMVQMLVKAQMNDAVGTPSPTTRSALEEPVLELPSNRLIFK